MAIVSPDTIPYLGPDCQPESTSNEVNNNIFHLHRLHQLIITDKDLDPWQIKEVGIKTIQTLERYYKRRYAANDIAQKEGITIDEAYKRAQAYLNDPKNEKLFADHKLSPAQFGDVIVDILDSEQCDLVTFYNQFLKPKRTK